VSLTFEASKQGYHNLWLAMDIRPEKDAAITRDAQRILANKDRYQAVEKKTGVPWFLIGCLHDLEGGMNFYTHLHNGDPLTARTVHVPAGRPLPPLQPPFKWEDSAVDALKMRRLDQIKVWSIERMLFEAEGYNGWGYQSRGINSPYDWAGSDNYDRGKFVSDGVFSATAVSQQIGVGPLLAKLSSLDVSVRLYSEVDTLSVGQVVKGSHGFRWLITTGVAYVLNLFHTQVADVSQFVTGLNFDDVRENVNQSISMGQEIASWFGYEAKNIMPYLVAAGLAMTAYHFFKSERVN
jgi:lysozyme family protein